MAKIAPLWQELTIRLFEDLKSGPIAETLKAMGGAWCAEMFAYNIAAAEMGVAHTVVHDLQRRDVDGKIYPPDVFQEPIIHIGRAWFPIKYTEGKKWWTTWAPDYDQWANEWMGAQVWVKTNHTSGSVIPWPLPPKLDHVSRYTLTALHDANENLPPLDEKSKYRRPGPYGYYAQYGF